MSEMKLAGLTCEEVRLVMDREAIRSRIVEALQEAVDWVQQTEGKKPDNKMNYWNPRRRGDLLRLVNSALAEVRGGPLVDFLFEEGYVE